jgi:hypothetical protein
MKASITKPTSSIAGMLGLAILSASMLIFEITLTRIFAIQQFYHFAFVVVSLAVMGFAGSGLLLAARRKPPSGDSLAFGYAVSILLAYTMINYLPFDSYSIAWDRKQIWILLAYFAAAGLPFLLAGWFIGAYLSSAGRDAHRPYASNLIGSALGCPLALLAIGTLGGERAALLSVCLGLGTALLAARSLARRIALSLSILMALVTLVSLPQQFKLQLSPYKPLSTLELALDTKLALTKWSPSRRLDVLETSTVHVYPGLSLNANLIPPEQVAVFLDGDGPIPITHLAPDAPLAAQLADHMPSSLAYKLRPGGRALILSPGGGLDVLLALASGATHVTLPSDEPLLLETLRGPYNTYTFGLMNDPRLELSSRSSRGLLERGGASYDVIQFALTDPYRPVTSGAFSLSENYLITLESIEQSFRRLSEDGLLVITRWLGTPPSESARVWATLVHALKDSNVHEPEEHLIAFRGLRTATMIASKRPFTRGEQERARLFLAQNALDPIAMPALEVQDLNQYNRLPEDVYYQLYRDLLEAPRATIAIYHFNLRPPTDDRPFFFHFFRWRQTPDILATLGTFWQPFGGSGYLVLLALLGLMIVFALPLALTPLVFLRQRHAIPSLGVRIPAYFAFLGAGYLLVEIPLIQRFTLLLDRPSLALATVLFCILLASGLGSLYSTRLKLRPSLASLVGYLIVMNATSPFLIKCALPWSLEARILVTCLLTFPAGFLMGIPFASGLRSLEERKPGLIPWAWAINGSVSGISGVLSAMIALDVGIGLALGAGTLAYLGALATAFSPKMQRMACASPATPPSLA